jgi:hypothetical protein
MASGISSLAEKATGKPLKLDGMVKSLSSASEGLGELSGKLIGKLPDKDKGPKLTPKQQSLVDSMNEAMSDGRLFEPSFDCAKLYLLSLKKLSPKSEIISIKANELMRVSLDTTTEYLYANEVEKAYELVTASKSILKMVKDEELRLRHRRVTSSVMIER